MADIAGATAAIEQRLKAGFPGGAIAFENTDPDDPSQPWPPVDEDGKPVLWLFCQVVDVESGIVGFGKPGAQLVQDTGFIKVFVMVPRGSGLAAARAKAVEIGELFRQAQFYDQEPPAYVRTKTPRIGRDPMVSEDGATVAGACCTVPYEFLHQA